MFEPTNEEMFLFAVLFLCVLVIVNGISDVIEMYKQKKEKKNGNISTENSKRIIK